MSGQQRQSVPPTQSLRASWQRSQAGRPQALPRTGWPWPRQPPCFWWHEQQSRWRSTCQGSWSRRAGPRCKNSLSGVHTKIAHMPPHPQPPDVVNERIALVWSMLQEIYALKWEGCGETGQRGTHHINHHESCLKPQQLPLTHASSPQHWPKSVEKTTKYDNARNVWGWGGGWGFPSAFLLFGNQHLCIKCLEGEIPKCRSLWPPNGMIMDFFFPFYFSIFYKFSTVNAIKNIYAIYIWFLCRLKECDIFIQS